MISQFRKMILEISRVQLLECVANIPMQFSTLRTRQLITQRLPEERVRESITVAGALYSGYQLPPLRLVNCIRHFNLGPITHPAKQRKVELAADNRRGRQDVPCARRSQCHAP